MSAFLVVVGDVTFIICIYACLYICMIRMRVCLSTSSLHSFVSSFLYDVRLVDEEGEGR